MSGHGFRGCGKSQSVTGGMYFLVGAPHLCGEGALHAPGGSWPLITRFSAGNGKPGLKHNLRSNAFPLD